jgi:type IV pilus assembly protein PilC
MPPTFFKCIAQDKDGRKVTHTLSADDVPSVVSQLKTKGLLPLKVYTIKSAQPSRPFFERSSVKAKEVMIFTRQLAAMLSSGLLLTEALEAIAEDLENRYFQRIILDISKEIRGGSDLSKALLKYPKVFPATYVAIISSGEATGTLSKTMKGLAQYLEDSERLISKVKGALTYPLFVVAFASLVVFGIVFFLIPKFQDMFSQAGAQLPLLTRIVMNISQFCVHNFIFLFLFIILASFAFWYCLRFYKFRYAIDASLLRIPLIGKDIIYKAHVSRFAQTLSVLMSGGVGLAAALEITSKVVNNLTFAEAIERIKNRIVGGASMSQEIRTQGIFPTLLVKMIQVGERTGRLPDMLQRTSEYYEEELEYVIHSLTSILEPALIIFIGSIICVVVIALYLPLFHISSAIH